MRLHVILKEINRSVEYIEEVVDSWCKSCYYLVTTIFSVCQPSANFGDVTMYEVYPVPSKCPVCGDSMVITRLHCPHCDVAVEGRFAWGRLARLTPEQLNFVEVYLRCDGKINRVESELGVSYPTVRGWLNEIIVALGYEAPRPEASEETTAERRRQVLDDLAAGHITSDQAVELLRGDGS